MNCECCKSTSVRVIGGLLAFMAIIALGSYATLNFEKVNWLNPTPATITISGEGEVNAVPDTSQFSFSVLATAEDAAEPRKNLEQKLTILPTT